MGVEDQTHTPDENGENKLTAAQYLKIVVRETVKGLKSSQADHIGRETVHIQIAREAAKNWLHLTNPDERREIGPQIQRSGGKGPLYLTVMRTVFMRLSEAFTDDKPDIKDSEIRKQLGMRNFWENFHPTHPPIK